jgi:tetratricopeptide (TPR) repeat protein
VQADIEALTDYKETPLLVAAVYASSDEMLWIFKMLLDRGADMRARNRYGDNVEQCLRNKRVDLNAKYTDAFLSLFAARLQADKPGPQRETEARELLAQGDFHVREGDPRKAAQMFKKSYDRLPTAEAAFAASKCLLELSDPRGAIDYASNATKIDPTHAMSWFYLINAYVLTRDFPRASMHCDSALKALRGSGKKDGVTRRVVSALQAALTTFEERKVPTTLASPYNARFFKELNEKLGAGHAHILCAYCTAPCLVPDPKFGNRLEEPFSDRTHCLGCSCDPAGPGMPQEYFIPL